jgi:hypothetical protein
MGDFFYNRILTRQKLDHNANSDRYLLMQSAQRECGGALSGEVMLRRSPRKR